MSKLFIDILTCYKYNAGQNIWQRLNKSKQNKNMISAFG